MQLLKDFCDYYIAIKGRSRRTATEYGKYINNFFEFFGRSYLPELDRIKSVTKRDINAYLVECMRRGNSESCRAGKISALRMFYQYLLEIDLLEVNPVAGIPRPSIPIRISKPLSLVDSIILIQAARDHKIDFYAKRNACMIEVFLNCGFRLSELTHIKLDDITDVSITVIGKGNKQRTVATNPSVRAAIADYLSVRRSDSEYLFVSRQGHPMASASVGSVIKNTIKAAGLDKSLSTHRLRHTSATLMYQYGQVDIRTIQAILGHASLQTTQRYTHVSQQQVTNAVNSNPLGAIVF